MENSSSDWPNLAGAGHNLQTFNFDGRILIEFPGFPETVGILASGANCVKSPEQFQTLKQKANAQLSIVDDRKIAMVRRRFRVVEAQARLAVRTTRSRRLARVVILIGSKDRGGYIARRN